MVAFILVLPLILFPIFNNINLYMDLHKYNTLKQVAREAILRMEIEGGLTQADYDAIMEYLEDQNFDTSNIHINYTPHPVNFGDEVAIEILYDYTKVRYTFGVGIKRVEESETMVCGPLKSTSKYYDN